MKFNSNISNSPVRPTMWCVPAPAMVGVDCIAIGGYDYIRDGRQAGYVGDYNISG